MAARKKTARKRVKAKAARRVKAGRAGAKKNAPARPKQKRAATAKPRGIRRAPAQRRAARPKRSRQPKASATPPQPPGASAAPRPPIASPTPATTEPSVATGAARPETPSAIGAALAVLASEPVRTGVVRRNFPRARAAQVALEAAIALGDRLHVRGATSDFLADVVSLRVDGAPAARAEAGVASLALPERARPGDVVYVLRGPA
jgi:hypothetical protein